MTPRAAAARGLSSRRRRRRSLLWVSAALALATASPVAEATAVAAAADPPAPMVVRRLEEEADLLLSLSSSPADDAAATTTIRTSSLRRWLEEGDGDGDGDDDDHDDHDSHDNHDDHDSHGHDDHDDHGEAKPAVAFGIVCGAGLSTAIGASVVFFPSLVKLASPRILAAGLGLSAGVMVYLSLTEAFLKSVESFVGAGHEWGKAYLYTTLSIFGGLALMIFIDKVVHFVSERSGAGGHGHALPAEGKPHHHRHHSCNDIDCNEIADEEILTPHCIGCISDPVAELSEWQQRADEERELNRAGPSKGVGLKGNDDDIDDTVEGIDLSGPCCPSSPPRKIAKDPAPGTITIESPAMASSDDELTEANCCETKTCRAPGDNGAPPGNKDGFRDSWKDEGDLDASARGGVAGATRAADAAASDAAQRKRLLRTGLGTAFAIALHNFPEGLATFVAGVNDPKVGGVLAVAIGLHNIPEGLCVALPIYYATGSRMRGFLFGLLSGLSEPLAAGIGWALLSTTQFDKNVFGTLFGIVAGMMLIISLKELLPTAHRYDPEDSVVTNSLIVGLAVMAASLTLFNMSGGHVH